MRSGLGAWFSAILAWVTTRPESGRQGRRQRQVWLVSAALLAIVVLITSVVAGSHTRHQQSLVPFDEGAHYDYIVQLDHGHVPRWGDRLSQPTLRILSCIGGPDATPRGCAVTNRDAQDYPADGYSYEAQQPPLAYLPYLLVARPNAPPWQALEDARRGGAIWAAIGAALLMWVGWLAELSLIEMFVALVICLLSPVQVYASATITNDSAGIAAGALGLGTYLFARRRDERYIVLGIVVGVIIGLLKGFLSLIPLIILLGVILTDVSARRKPTREDFWRRYGCVLAMLVSSAVTYAGWVLLQDVRATVSSKTVLYALQSFAVVPYLKPATIFGGLQNQLSDLASYTGAPLYAVWNLAVYGSLAGVVLLKSLAVQARDRAWAAAIFIVMALFAVLYPLFSFFEGHYNFAAQIRYGIPFLPFVAFVLVRSTRMRGLLIIGIALPALALTAQLVGGQF